MMGIAIRCKACDTILRATGKLRSPIGRPSGLEVIVNVTAPNSTFFEFSKIECPNCNESCGYTINEEGNLQGYELDGELQKKLRAQEFPIS